MISSFSNCFTLTHIIIISSRLSYGLSQDNLTKLANSTERIYEEVLKKEDEKFTNDISALKNITDPDSLREQAINYRTDLKTLHTHYLHLSTENSNLEKNITLIEKILCHQKIKVLVIQEIENYEADLDAYESTVKDIENYEAGFDSQHTYESPDANTSSIFRLDNDLSNLTDSQVKREELRKQRWKFYLARCPTEKIKKLKKMIDQYGNLLEKMDFSTAIAKLHRKISTELRESAVTMKKYPEDYRLYSGGEEFNVVPVLFKGIEIDSRMKAEINKNIKMKHNLKLH